MTFYKDGHYDAVVKLSDNLRYFIYLGQRPEITEQMMTVTGAMVYTDDELVTIIEDGDAEGRKAFIDEADFEKSLDKYYELRGWNSEGIPTKQGFDFFYGLFMDRNILCNK